MIEAEACPDYIHMQTSFSLKYSIEYDFRQECKFEVQIWKRALSALKNISKTTSNKTR